LFIYNFTYVLADAKLGNAVGDDNNLNYRAFSCLFTEREIKFWFATLPCA